MVRSGHMIALFNNDRPGMVGEVGAVIGKADVNIDEMVIGHGDKDGVAMMVIKIGTPSTPALLDALANSDGISKVACAKITPAPEK